MKIDIFVLIRDFSHQLKILRPALQVVQVKNIRYITTSPFSSHPGTPGVQFMGPDVCLDVCQRDSSDCFDFLTMTQISDGVQIGEATVRPDPS